MSEETIQAPTTGSEAMRLFLPHSPFVQHLGIELVDIGDDHARLRMPFRDNLVTVGEMVHGGALAACIDIGIMAAAWAGPRVPEKLRGVTVSMSVEFLEPAFAEDVDIIGTRVRQGRRLSNCTVDIVTTGGGTLVAKGMGTYQVG
ncbi:PaaI family thioesterase [Rhodococcus sp. UNC363MFTsu5.1]|uniref:PaaI family thioesterase n=1 Tax=Rhodococcus sp. UNC363MFTsu5.1 TaxID=1449069 RepID=UPI000486E147|nr:PaaI family thioesterase [Rhodococcus sp. UNC363MFTsu5.1]